MDITIPSKKQTSQFLQDLVDSLLIIKINIEAYDKGAKSVYKVIAVQLRILLCDTNRGSDNSLIYKVFKNPKFHPFPKMPHLEQTKKDPKTRTLLFIPGTFTSNSNRIFNLFDKNLKKISLQKWLNQNCLDFSITIKDLIKSIADKDGGAHVDAQLNDTLRKTSTTFLNGEVSHAIYLIEIGRYIYEEISTQLVGYEKSDNF